MFMTGTLRDIGTPTAHSMPTAHNHTAAYWKLVYAQSHKKPPPPRRSPLTPPPPPPPRRPPTTVPIPGQVCGGGRATSLSHCAATALASYYQPSWHQHVRSPSALHSGI